MLGTSVLSTAVGLLALAAAVTCLGDLVRRPLTRWSRLLALRDPVERGLIDLYLGGGLFYVLAALPFGLFWPALLWGILGVGAVGGAFLLWWWPSRLGEEPSVASPRRDRWAWGISLATAAALFAVELSALPGVGSGNTYDSSLLATYTGLLGLHHTLPLQLAPVASGWTAYPQGTTVWLALTQTVLGTSPVRTSLFLTPLFLAVFPLAGYAAGRRLTGSAAQGAAIAVWFALVAPWTRELAFGSNDFALAAPLVLVLAGWVPEWSAAAGVGWRDAVAFGGLVGYSAALNPVGAEWLFLGLAVWLFAHPTGVAAFGRTLGRYAVALVAAVPWVAPSLYALLVGHAGGAGGLAPTGLGAPAWVGAVDPFLFGPGDQFLSPFPILRAELAVLLVAGAGLLLTPWGRREVSGPYARFLLVGGGVAAGLLGVSALAGADVPGFRTVAVVLSATEESILLFVVFGLLAAVPLLVLSSLLGRPSPRPPTLGAARPRLRRPSSHAALVGVLVALLLVPGGFVTAAELPRQLHQVYGLYGNTTESDVDLLEWCAAHLSPGTTVLVAPGSAAEFLPGYDPSLRVEQPMASGYRAGPPAYWLAVSELTNDTLDAAGVSAIHSLGIQYVAVTGNNTVLFPAFRADPMLALGWPTPFQEGDAYLFAVPG